MSVSLPRVTSGTLAAAADFNAVSARAEYAGNTLDDMTGPLVDYTSENPWGADTSAPAIGSGQIGFRWGKRPGHIIRIEFGIVMASDTTIGSGQYKFNFPSGITQRVDANQALVSGPRGQAYVIHTNTDSTRTIHMCVVQVFASNYFRISFQQFSSPYQLLTLGSSSVPFPSGSWNNNSWIGGWLEAEI